MPAVLEYKCPACGGKAEFDSASQMMKCPYCDTTFDVSAMEEMDQILEQQPAQELRWESEDQQWNEEETSQMQVFVCNSCGGELVTDQTTAATHCPYCDNPVVLSGRLSGDLKPDLVIPFKLDKEAAKAALLKHCAGKKLVPRSFKSENRLEEIKGVYVPFWLFDADVNATVHYKATKVRSWSDSRYHYTETKHFAVTRGGSLAFDRVPVDGSSRMPDDLMESIEPFDASQAVDFQTAYLSGYLADRYDVNEDKSKERAKQRVKISTEVAFQDTVSGYTSVNAQQTNIQTNNGKAKYALYPVWMLTTQWRGKKYIFAMNGQTGKFTGDLPMDRGAYWLWWAIWTGILSAGAFVLIFLLKLFNVF